MISPKQLTIVYKALVFSKINYGIEIYGRNSKAIQGKFQNAQNRFLRIIFRKNITISSTFIHQNANILTFTHNLSLRQLLLIHRAIHDRHKIPHYLKSNIIESTAIHNRNTRHKNDIFLNALSYQTNNKVLDAASIVWNALDQNLKTEKNRTVFRNKIVLHYFQTYIG